MTVFSFLLMSICSKEVINLCIIYCHDKLKAMFVFQIGVTMILIIKNLNFKVKVWIRISFSQWRIIALIFNLEISSGRALR